jgi:hypothetical protein
MDEFKYLNNELEIELGDVFIHKADDRKMVVVNFEFYGGDMSMKTKDRNIPLCKYFDDKLNKYVVDRFMFFELRKEN